MSCYTTCPHCSNYLSKVYKFFEAVKESNDEENFKKLKGKIHIDTIDLKSGVNEDLKFIMDALGFKNPCCSTHLLSYDNVRDSSIF